MTASFLKRALMNSAGTPWVTAMMQVHPLKKIKKNGQVFVK
jgi:hypothetical protein